MKLKPWAQVVLAFIIGVVTVSQIFKLTGSEASTGGQQVIHGVISMNLDGKSSIKQIDGAFEQDIELDTKEDYKPLEIVTVVLKDGKVVNDYLTYGKELDALMNGHEHTIAEYRQGIADIIYEQNY